MSNTFALCLSGGGFRATLFHAGAVRRLNELGVLSRISAFTGVSGGSIFGGVLASRWNALLRSQRDGIFHEYEELVEKPIRRVCADDLRTDVLLWNDAGRLDITAAFRPHHNITDRLAAAYANRLQLGVSLRSLPGQPRFVFCATNLQTGACWRFEGGPDGRIGDPYVGWRWSGAISLSQAVASSSAFPPVFPPFHLSFDDPESFSPDPAVPPDKPDTLLPDSARREVYLTDGGVYDNLGLEPVWECHGGVLVSDASTPFDRHDEQAGPGTATLLKRGFDIIYNQVGGLRKRWLIERFIRDRGKRCGAYWGISSGLEGYLKGAELGNVFAYPEEVLPFFARVRTDLDPFSAGEIACLLNHGYALANVAVRRWCPELVAPNARPFRLPEPDYADTAAVRRALGESEHRGVVRDIWNALREHLTGWFHR
jgi:NTE family protein